MDKKEILKKSREENQTMDEREMLAHANAGKTAVAIGGLVCMIIILLESIFTDKVSVSTWMVYLAMVGTSHLCLFRNLNKKSDLFFGIVFLLLAVVFSVMYILDLTGIHHG